MAEKYKIRGHPPLGDRPMESRINVRCPRSLFLSLEGWAMAESAHRNDNRFNVQDLVREILEKAVKEREG